MVNRFARYIKDTRTEMRHVSWPTRAQTVGYTVLVIAISLLVAFFISIFDTAFTRALDWGVIKSTPTEAPSVEANVVDVNTDANVDVAPVFNPTGVEGGTSTQ